MRNATKDRIFGMAAVLGSRRENGYVLALEATGCGGVRTDLAGEPGEK